MIHKTWMIALVIYSITGIGCRSDNDALPSIRYGEDACDRCRMIISEKQFAAAYKIESGDVWKFDDLGCAILHQQEHGETVKQFWVYDYKETAWLDVKQAFFVHSSNLLTPMGYGIAAFTTEANAENLSKKMNDHIVPFDQLMQILASKR